MEKMNMFVKGQKVICVNDDHEGLTKNKIYQVLDSLVDGIEIKRDQGMRDYNFSYRFQTIIQTIDDIVVGMELTHNFRGKVIIIDVFSHKNYDEINYTTGVDSWFTRDIENFKEYQPEIREEKTMCKEKEYEVVGDGFTVIDIYEKDPCKNEFKELLKEDSETYCSYDSPWKDLDDIGLSKVLMRNLSWLEQKGFIKEKDKDVVLEPGMELIVQHCTERWTVINSQQGQFYLSNGIILFNFNGLLEVPKTLNELNNLKGEAHNTVFEVVDA